MPGLSIVVALLLDRLLGEPSRGHPLVAFGSTASRLETRSRSWAIKPEIIGAPFASKDRRLRWAGTVSWLILVMVPTLLMSGLQLLSDGLIEALLGVTTLYFCIGMRSLQEHARAVARPLREGDVERARESLSRIVSRDTAHLDAPSVSQATVESVLENGSDAVLAPIFWFVLAGAPGVLCYRLTNTLDAMWGYRNDRYLQFGCTAARMDDVLNWIPARGCALAYALVGSCRRALSCWGSQSAMWDSPNAGPVMAAGAGALGIQLGGTARYHGQPYWRPALGQGSLAEPEDIERALALLWRATALWLLVILVWGLLL